MTTLTRAVYHFVFLFLCLLSVSVMAQEPEDHLAEDFTLTTLSGEDLSLKRWMPTAQHSNPPILIWITEAFGQNPSFKKLMQGLAHQGFEVWQLDLLESYFLERTKENVRSLKGTGVQRVLEAAQQSQRPFVLAATGRMSLAALRGSRMFQLNQGGRGLLQGVMLYFPNVFEAPRVAGEALDVFPIVKSTHLPLVIFQPESGAYRYQMAKLVTQLDQQNSPVYLKNLPGVRDYFFLRQDLSPKERQATAQMPKDMMRFFQLLRKDQQDYVAIKDIEEFVIKPVEKGLVAVNNLPTHDFSLTDTQGKTQRLADFKGKVVLLNFWASWCGPCVHEIPSMNALKDKLQGQEFEILSVNYKQSPAEIQQFMQEVNVDFAVLLDTSGKVADMWNIFAFPSSFVLDKHHRVRYSLNQSIDWNTPETHAIIEKLLQE